VLPHFLKPLFWEYQFEDLSWETDRDLVISRVLVAGQWDAIQWLRQRLTPRELRAWIVARRGRGLSPAQLRFWELVLDLPHRDVNAWLAAMRRDPWLHRWQAR
jgi:hypothetical protein